MQVVVRLFGSASFFDSATERVVARQLGETYVVFATLRITNLLVMQHVTVQKQTDHLYTSFTLSLALHDLISCLTSLSFALSRGVFGDYVYYEWPQGRITEFLKGRQLPAELFREIGVASYVAERMGQLHSMTIDGLPRPQLASANGIAVHGTSNNNSCSSCGVINGKRNNRSGNEDDDDDSSADIMPTSIRYLQNWSASALCTRLFASCKARYSRRAGSTASSSESCSSNDSKSNSSTSTDSTRSSSSNSNLPSTNDSRLRSATTMKELIDAWDPDTTDVSELAKYLPADIMPYLATLFTQSLKKKKIKRADREKKAMSSEFASISTSTSTTAEAATGLAPEPIALSSSASSSATTSCASTPLHDDGTVSADPPQPPRPTRRIALSILGFLDLEAAEAELAWLLPQLLQVNSPILMCHNDLHSGNVLFEPVAEAATQPRELKRPLERQQQDPQAQQRQSEQSDHSESRQGNEDEKRPEHIADVGLFLDVSNSSETPPVSTSTSSRHAAATDDANVASAAAADAAADAAAVDLQNRHSEAQDVGVDADTDVDDGSSVGGRWSPVKWSAIVINAAANSEPDDRVAVTLSPSPSSFRSSSNSSSVSPSGTPSPSPTSSPSLSSRSPLVRVSYPSVHSASYVPRASRVPTVATSAGTIAAAQRRTYGTAVAAGADGMDEAGGREGNVRLRVVSTSSSSSSSSSSSGDVYELKTTLTESASMIVTRTQSTAATTTAETSLASITTSATASSSKASSSSSSSSSSLPLPRTIRGPKPSKYVSSSPSALSAEELATFTLPEPPAPPPLSAQEAARLMLGPGAAASDDAGDVERKVVDSATDVSDNRTTDSTARFETTTTSVIVPLQRSSGESNPCRVIDFEYAGWNFRGFDVANSLCEVYIEVRQNLLSRSLCNFASIYSHCMISCFMFYSFNLWTDCASVFLSPSSHHRFLTFSSMYVLLQYSGPYPGFVVDVQRSVSSLISPSKFNAFERNFALHYHRGIASASRNKTNSRSRGDGDGAGDSTAPRSLTTTSAAASLSSTATIDALCTQLLKEASWFTLASHLQWTYWGIVLADNGFPEPATSSTASTSSALSSSSSPSSSSSRDMSTTSASAYEATRYEEEDSDDDVISTQEFGYIEYAFMRWAMYLMRKKMLLREYSQSPS